MPPNPVREHILHLRPLLADDRIEFLTPVSRLHETLPLAKANFLKSSGALTSNVRPYHPPKMPSIPSEVDIADITDEEDPD